MKKALVVAALLLPPLTALVVLCTHWVAVPYWDDWGTPGEQLASWYRGTLTLAELVSQHNEHRRFFPRLVAFAVTSVAGWDVRYLMALLFAFICAGAAALYRLLQANIAQAAVRVAAFGAMDLLLFSPREYETLLAGSILADLFVPAFAIVAAALMNLSRRSFATKTLVNALLALVSTYTFANGMLVWLLAFPLATDGTPTVSRRSRLGWRIGYGAAALLAIGCYFVGYHHPPLSPTAASLVRQPSELLTYFFIWAGNLFLVRHPALLGAAVLLLVVGLSLAALLQSKRSGEWRAHYPWLLLACYGLVSGAVTARSRLALGYEGASHFRYTAVAVVGLGASLLARWTLSRARMNAILGIFAAVVLTLWITTWRQETRLVRRTAAQRQHLQLVMRWSEAIPDNPDLALLSPYASTRATIRTLAAKGALRPPLIDPEFARVVSSAPGEGDNSAGALEQVREDPVDHTLVVKGWARGEYVVIGYEAADRGWKLLTLAEPQGGRSRFRQAVPAGDVPQGGNTFRGWVIDRHGERARPLSGQLRLDAPGG